MGEPHIISALKSKRAEIAGVVAELEKELAERRLVLQHVDATLRLFAPDCARRHPAEETTQTQCVV